MRSIAALLSLSVLTVVTLIAANTQAATVRNLAVTPGTTTKIKLEVDVSSNQLDILFVIDDSGSMSGHQANFLNNIDALTKAALASGVDVQAGVITTSVDLSDWSSVTPGRGLLVGPVKRFAHSADPNFSQVLRENLLAAMTTNGSGTEQPFAAILMAMDAAAAASNKGFFRDTAATAVFVVTDADDQSTFGVPEFLSLVQSRKPNAPFSFGGAFIPSSDTTCGRAGEPVPTKIETLIGALGKQGFSVGLCDKDYSLKIKTIGESYASIGLRSVQLPVAPVFASIKVTYGSLTLVPGHLGTGWSYDETANVLQLGPKIDWKSQPKGTKLIIEFEAQ